MRIIYEQASGVLGVLIPAPKFLNELKDKETQQYAK